MIMIRMFRNNENKLILFSKSEFTYCIIEADFVTDELRLVSDRFTEGRIDRGIYHEKEKYNTDPTPVVIFLFKKKASGLSSRILKEAEETTSDSKNSILVYYGRSPSCKECDDSFIWGSGGNGLGIVTLVFGFFLLVFTMTWLIMGIVILCRKGPKISKKNNKFKKSEKAEFKPNDRLEEDQEEKDNIEFQMRKSGEFETRSVKSIEQYGEPSKDRDFEKNQNIYAFS